MSIRLRLTILYSAIVALTLIAFSIMLYVVVSRVAMNTEQQVLKDEATRITSTVDVANFPRISYPAARLAARETLVQFRQRDGSVTGKTDNLAQLTMELPLSQSAMADVFAHGSRMDFVSMQDGQRLLVYSKPAKVQGLGPPFGVIQVARPMTSYYETLQTLRDILAVSTVVVTLLAFVIGYVLAGAALRPINRLRQTAQAIGSERDFSRRVKYDGPPDEVGRLAMTFNDMLAALQSAYQTQRRFVADASHELRTR
ncbi:MAG: HAMP domain-containing protein [Chloroflexia bacterium]